MKATSSAAAVATSSNRLTAPVNGPSVTELINRTDFTSKPTRLFADFFERLSNAMITSDLFRDCVPKPEDIRLENTALQLKKQESINNRSDANTGIFKMAVAEAKITASAVAAFTEQVFPGDKDVAAIVGMTYNKKPGKLTPAPSEAVTNLRVETANNGCTVKWKNLQGLSNRVSYNVYMSIDESPNFTLVKGVTNSIKGVFVRTEMKKVYTFYVIAETTGGEGPESVRVRFVGQ